MTQMGESDIGGLQWLAEISQSEFAELLDGIDPGIEKAVEEYENRKDAERDDAAIKELK